MCSISIQLHTHDDVGDKIVRNDGNVLGNPKCVCPTQCFDACNYAGDFRLEMCMTDLHTHTYTHAHTCVQTTEARRLKHEWRVWCSSCLYWLLYWSIVHKLCNMYSLSVYYLLFIIIVFVLLDRLIWCVCVYVHSSVIWNSLIYICAIHISEYVWFVEFECLICECIQ